MKFLDLVWFLSWTASFLNYQAEEVFKLLNLLRSNLVNKFSQNISKIKNIFMLSYAFKTNKTTQSFKARKPKTH